jgi:transposase
MGRPTKLNAATQKAIIEAIQAGMYEKDAALYAGISEPTFHNWMARGREGEAPFLEFQESVKKARAVAQHTNIQIIRTAAEDGNWQAAAWWLERSFPKLWGRRTEHTVINRDAMVDLIVELEAELAVHDQPD